MGTRGEKSRRRVEGEEKNSDEVETSFDPAAPSTEGKRARRTTPLRCSMHLCRRNRVQTTHHVLLANKAPLASPSLCAPRAFSSE